MKSINATLPREMPTAVEIGQGASSYQNLSTFEEEAQDDTNFNSPEPLMSRIKSPVFMRLGAAFILVLAFMLLIVSRRDTRVNSTPTGSEGMSLESVNDPWMYGQTVATSYCKTSCTSQCSSYFSVYGPLCCDWAEGNRHLFSISLQF